MAQAVNLWPLHVGFVVERLVLEKKIFKSLGFTLLLSFHKFCMLIYTCRRLSEP